MLGEKLLDPVGFMRGQVIADDMDFFALGLVGHEICQEGDKLCAGMPRRGLAQHLAGFGVEGGIHKRACRAGSTPGRAAARFKGP